MLERDKGTYSVVTLNPLCDVFSLVRYPEDPQMFGIEFITGKFNKYSCTDRLVGLVLGVVVSLCCFLSCDF